MDRSSGRRITIETGAQRLLLFFVYFEIAFVKFALNESMEGSKNWAQRPSTR